MDAAAAAVLIGVGMRITARYEESNIV